MDSPRPVPDQVLLTDHELSKLVAGAAIGANQIRSLFAVLHDMRLGDPVGTVRRSAAGSIALRTQISPGCGSNPGALLWDYLHLSTADPEEPTEAETVAWQRIHTESWFYRLTVEDYKREDNE